MTQVLKGIFSLIFSFFCYSLLWSLQTSKWQQGGGIWVNQCPCGCCWWIRLFQDWKITTVFFFLISLLYAVSHITQNFSILWLYLGVRLGKLKCDQLQWPLCQWPIVFLLNCSQFTQHTRFSINHKYMDSMMPNFC